MRPQSAAWERAGEVREAADGWLRAGIIDGRTHEAIARAYPDPRVTPAVPWRVLTAGIVTAVVLCALGAVGIATEPRTTGLCVLLFVFAAACIAATERLEGSPRLARRGAAGATAFWGSVFLLAALGLSLHEGARIAFDHATDIVLVAGALVWGVGCWRWGNPVFAGFSAISLFLFLGRLPLGRVLWVLAGSALTGLAARHLDDGGWAPSHRRAATIVLVTAVAAVYVAVNVYSLDTRLLESLRPFVPRHLTVPPAGFALAALATALLPLVVLAWGLVSRRPVVLDTGIVLVALSLATLRHYVHVAPLWTVLTASGAALVGLALIVERTLRRSPGGERAGFTADALFSDERRQRLLETVPVVGAFTPAAPVAPAQEKGFAGGGGTFGGGGASEKF
jgi:hypothetical protein